MGDGTKNADILETLDDILEHKIFASSPKAQDFLRYIITESLAGREDNLNGTTIAQDVLQKDADFDSLQDSVVRVTARRVRYMLQDYYAQATHGPKIKITIPKGKYRPHFEFINTPAEPSAPAVHSEAQPKYYKVFWGMVIVAACLFTSAIGYSSFKSQTGATAQIDDISSYPSIAIIPFTNQTDNDAYSFLEKSLQKQLTEDLSRFSLIRPISYDGAYESLLTKDAPQYDYAITGVMLGVEPEIDVYIKLIDLKKTDIIFEDRIRRTPGESQYYDALFNMVTELSGNFAGMEGVIVQDSLGYIKEKIAAGTDALSDLSAFECHSLIDELQAAPSPEIYKTIYGCTESLLEKEPENDTLLAAFGWLTYIGAVSHEPVLMARSVNPDIDADTGYAMIEKAVELNPENAWAQQVLSSLKLYQGDVEAALAHAEMAVLENPANPDNLTWLSVCLAHNGKWERAIELAQEALDRNPDASAPYYYTFFLKGLNDNDAAAMKAAAEPFILKESYYAQLYSYLAAVAADDRDKVRELKPTIDEIADRNDGNIMTVIKARMPSKDLQEKAQRLIDKGEIISSEVDG